MYSGSGGNSHIPLLGRKFYCLLQHGASCAVLLVGGPWNESGGISGIFDGLWLLLRHDSCLSPQHSSASFVPSEGLKTLGPVCECSGTSLRSGEFYTWAISVEEQRTGMSGLFPLSGSNPSSALNKMLSAHPLCTWAVPCTLSANHLRHFKWKIVVSHQPFTFHSLTSSPPKQEVQRMLGVHLVG